MCSDGIDNDCDGSVDCADTGCSSECCGYENSECCTSGDDCFGALYCSTLNPTYGTSVDPHCCSTGYWWDAPFCVQYTAVIQNALQTLSMMLVYLQTICMVVALFPEQMILIKQ